MLTLPTCQWTLQSILLVSWAFLREQISLHGYEAHPVDGGLEYDLSGSVEILIRKMPEDPDGLTWSELQNIIAGLWDYIVTGMRYRPVTFDVLDTEDDAQIGWGHIVNGERKTISNTTAKRDVRIVAPALPSSANLILSQRNSSLPSPLNPLDWPVEDSDMTLRISTFRAHTLDPEAVRNLFIVLTEIAQRAIAAKGEDAPLGVPSVRYGSRVVLEVINQPHMLTWKQFGEVILGLIDFMVDHNHYKSCFITIYVGNPKVEIGNGKVARGIFQHNNFTVARRNAVDEGGAG